MFDVIEKILSNLFIIMRVEYKIEPSSITARRNPGGELHGYAPFRVDQPSVLSATFVELF